MKPIIYKYNFFRKPQAERKQPVLSSSAIWCAPLRDVRLSCWRWWRRSRKRQRNRRKSSFKSCSRKSLSSRWETLSWIISYTLRITSSSYRSVSLCLLTSQDNTHTAHAEGFLLSPAVDWSIPVQSSTHQELVWDQYEHWCECGDSEESSDSAAGNTRWETQSIW